MIAVTGRSGHLLRLAAALFALAAAAAPLEAAQPAAPPVRVRTTRPTVVMETPRGDSLVLGKVDAGTVLEVVQRRGRWTEVTALAGTPAFAWKRGWVIDDDLEWRRLDVLRTEAGGPFDAAGVVEFVAYHRSRTDRTDRGRLHEVSRFVREGDRWYYVDGDVG